MSEIADFGTVILLVSASLGLALLSMKLTERLPIPSPAIFLLAAAVMVVGFLVLLVVLTLIAWRRFGAPYGVFVLAGEFDALEPLAKKRWSVPYRLCFEEAILRLPELCELGSGDRIQCVFDDNEKHRGWGREAYRTLRKEFPQHAGVFVEEVAFTSRHESAEMEAADFFAYELRKITYNGLTDPSRNVRYGFRQMIRPGWGIWRINLSQVIPAERRIGLANEDA